MPPSETCTTFILLIFVRMKSRKTRQREVVCPLRTKGYSDPDVRTYCCKKTVDFLKIMVFTHYYL